MVERNTCRFGDPIDHRIGVSGEDMKPLRVRKLAFMVAVFCSSLRSAHAEIAIPETLDLSWATIRTELEQDAVAWAAEYKPERLYVDANSSGFNYWGPSIE